MQKIRNGGRETVTDTKNIKGIIQDLFALFYTAKSANLDKIFIEE